MLGKCTPLTPWYFAAKVVPTRGLPRCGSSAGRQLAMSSALKRRFEIVLSRKPPARERWAVQGPLTRLVLLLGGLLSLLSRLESSWLSLF